MATPNELFVVDELLAEWGLPELIRMRIIDFIPRLVTWRNEFGHRMYEGVVFGENKSRWSALVSPFVKRTERRIVLDMNNIHMIVRYSYMFGILNVDIPSRVHSSQDIVMETFLKVPAFVDWLVERQRTFDIEPTHVLYE